MTFSSGLKVAVQNIFLANNLRISRTVNRQRLIDFLDTIKPITTEHPLIRLGASSDGGYLLPDDLQDIAGCFSPGVSEIAEFEDDLSRRGMPCFLADHSVEGPPMSNPLFDFEKKFLGSSNTGTFMTLENWVSRKSSGSSDLLLQMDIEGAEYEVIRATSRDVLRRFRILVIEFHRLDGLFEELGFQLIESTFKKLIEEFDVVHIHPNNFLMPLEFQEISIPPMMEFTFLRKDRVKLRMHNSSFPHPLDHKNVETNPDLTLPKCWY